MFDGVNKKLERADYFLNNLKRLAEDAGGLPHIMMDKQQEMRANLDGFFFEVISAKDFFLQGINDKYKVGLRKKYATNIGKLKSLLTDGNALKVLDTIDKLLSDQDSWLWRLNNYRNSATHRELLHIGYEVKVSATTSDRDLFNKMQQGKIVLKPIHDVEEMKTLSKAKKLDIQTESHKAFLFKDPEDPKQGNIDLEVIPYCEESLNCMRKFLEGLYSKLASAILTYERTGENRRSVANWFAIGVFILFLIIFCIIWIPAFGRPLDSRTELLRTGYFLQSLATFVGMAIALYLASKRRAKTQSHLPSKLIKWIAKHDMVAYILFWTLLFFLIGMFAKVVALFLLQ